MFEIPNGNRESECVILMVKTTKMLERFVIRISLYTIFQHYITSKNMICCLCVKLMLHLGLIRNVLRSWVGTLYPFSEQLSKMCTYSQFPSRHLQGGVRF